MDYQNDLELQRLAGNSQNSHSDSDLDPPFEIHGIQQSEQPLETFSPFQGADQSTAMEDESSSEEDAPHSLQFEQQHLPPTRPNFDIPRGQRNSHTQRMRPSRTNLNAHIASPIILSWNDVSNLDDFLRRLYDYYEGYGLICIIFASLTNLMYRPFNLRIVAFVVSLTLFLSECIDYSKIHDSKTLSQVLVPYCLSSMRWTTTLVTFGIGSWWSYTMIRTILYEIPRLIEIRNFTLSVLNITDQELQTMLWNDFNNKILTTKNNSDSSHQHTAHTIANRIMRKENYIIAMFNKDVLDLSIPLIGKGQWLTRMMQDYMIYYGIFGYVFDEKGKFKKRFLKEQHRSSLTLTLQRRFKQMAVLAFILSPILFVYLIVQSFFKLSEEYRQNPALLGARAYSPASAWRMREFNELPHLFNRRLTRSHENAAKYMSQFPNQLLIILARFVSFISGSFATVLLIITLFEEELQQGFEITPNRSALFYIGVFGSILAVTQSLSQENIVHEPQRWMNAVVLDTHYQPNHWRDAAHTITVRDEFSTFFDHKIVLLMYELLSVLLVPLILYTSLSDSAGRIVDFFREFTIHVESVGYICSFAIFDFEKHGNVKYGARNEGNTPVNEHFVSNNGKMEQSFVNFKINNPNWNPGLQGSQFISKVIGKRPGRTNASQMWSPTRSISQSEMPMDSMIQGESVLASSYEGPENIGREFVGLLDALYKANQL